MGLFLKYSKNPEKEKHRQSGYKYIYVIDQAAIAAY